ncbi:hypothetical protein PFISCL1PPCAC_1636, partial [Pristionchus fissidentatus]
EEEEEEDEDNEEDSIDIIDFSSDNSDLEVIQRFSASRVDFSESDDNAEILESGSSSNEMTRSEDVPEFERSVKNIFNGVFNVRWRR